MTASVEGPDLGELARLAEVKNDCMWTVPVGGLSMAYVAKLANAAPFLLAQAAAVQRVRELCDVVRRLQPADPDTGDRDVSFFALLEALGADDA